MPLHLTGTATGITRALADVRRSLANAEVSAGRPAGSVTLVAVSKTQPVERIAEALSAGQRVFGENRVQEARSKWEGVREHHPDLELHLIGPLQTNKAREAVALFDVIETLDRPRLAEALAQEAARTGRCPHLLVEVNTGAESQKAGILPADADSFIALCRNTYRLPISGLMCIPPVDEEPSLHFALLAQIAQRNGLDLLSMGMSADYPLAVRFGATHVRVGSAIFGDRPAAPPFPV